MTHELPSVTPAPADTLDLVDYSHKLIGRLKHDREEGKLIGRASDPHMQPLLDELAAFLMASRLYCSVGVHEEKPLSKGCTSYAYLVDISHPGYLCAVTENLYKYKIAGKPVVGIFPEHKEDYNDIALITKNITTFPVELPSKN